MSAAPELPLPVPTPPALELLTPRELAGLDKVGDVVLPGDGTLPPFSAVRSPADAERMLAHMTEKDRRGVKGVLAVFSFLPTVLVRAFYWLTDQHGRLPGALAAPFRMANIGIKGVVMTLYYTDSRGGIHDAIGWDARVVAPGETPVPRTPLPVPEPPAPARPTPASAFAAVRAGRESLRALGVRERLDYVTRLKQVILARREEIIDRIQKDTGKSRADALISEIFGVLDNLHWLEKHAAKALRDRKQPTPIALMGKTSWTWYEPLGTILVIAPWNYPFYQAIVPIAHAFAAGNTVVFKPSEWTPLEGLVEDLLGAAGFAPAWVQVVYGDGVVGAACVAERPDKVFFTGSTRTGRKILAAAADDLVPVELELGGKDPTIVFADVNLERAAAGVAWGGLTTTGQSCTSVERCYVERSVYEPFKQALVREVARLRQETDRDGDADLGAMTTDFQVAIVARHVADAKTKGAHFLTGGDWDGRSRMIPPMVLDGVTPDMAVVSDETFGPVIPLIPFESEDEAVRAANDSPYGLTASVWSKDIARAKRVARALETGGVSINNVMATEANPALPFGGTKQSGFGRYKGEHGLHAFCNVKSVLVDKDSKKIEANWYPYTREKYRLFTELTLALFGGGLRNFVKFALTGMKLEKYSTQVSRTGRPGPPPPPTVPPPPPA
jgi:aldehyde dehydrogenase (NAD+)